MVILSEFHAPLSRVLYEQANTRALLDNKDLGVGSLLVSERTLCWKDQAGAGFSVEYPHISMHAITTDASIYHSECVLVVFDDRFTLPDPSQPLGDNDESDDESESDVSQLVLVPPDSDSIRSIYNALRVCQSLNPDPEDAMSDDEDENLYEDVEDHSLDRFAANATRQYEIGGGDMEINELSAQLSNRSLYDDHIYGNGDQNFDDDQFEDVD